MCGEKRSAYARARLGDHALRLRCCCERMTSMMRRFFVAPSLRFVTRGTLRFGAAGVMRMRACVTCGVVLGVCSFASSAMAMQVASSSKAA